jgi:hypothetical protein
MCGAASQPQGPFFLPPIFSHSPQIISPTDVSTVETLILTLREHLGNLPLVVMKGKMESHFIEAILDCGGCETSCTGTLLSPRVHRLEMIVEGIIIGPILDDCLLSFIRRVFEEIDVGKKNSHLICSNCRAEEGPPSRSLNASLYPTHPSFILLPVNGKLSVFSLDDIRTKKQLVLSTLKACIIEGGDISIQLFMTLSRLLPSNLTFPDHAHLLCSEPSVACIQIIRRYHFTYIDSAALLALSPIIADTALPSSPPLSHFQNLSTTPLSTPLLIRCFSQFPIDSLMRGLFLTQEEGDKYRQVCIRYSRALERRNHAAPSGKGSGGDEKSDSNFLSLQWLQGNASSSSSIYLQREELVLEEVLTHYSRMALKALESGEFVQAGRWFLVLQAILSTSTEEGAKAHMTPHHPTHPPSTHSSRSKSSHSHGAPRPSLSLYELSSHCLQQIASLSGQSIGKLDSIREMIDSFLSCLRLFINDYLDTPASVNSTSAPQLSSPSTSLSSDGQENLFFQYDAICSHLLEVKAILYSLYRDRDAYQSSEILLTLDEFLRIIDSLFSETTLSQSILPTSQTLKHSHSNHTSRALIPLEMMKALRSLSEPLGQISFGLKFLCGSLGGELLLELLQMDLDARYNYKTPSTGPGAKFAHPPRSQEKELPITTPPSTFSELIGQFTISLLLILWSPQGIAKQELLESQRKVDHTSTGATALDPLLASSSTGTALITGDEERTSTTRDSSSWDPSPL